MKKLYKLIPLLFAILFGCSSPNKPLEKVESFFPLTTGNKWYYNSSTGDTSSIDDVWEITAQKEIDNKKYYEIIEHHIKNNLNDTVYYRLNGDTLFSKRIDYQEHIVADFSLNLNETAYWQNDLKVVQKTENIMTFETPYEIDYGYTITFQRGVGIVSIDEKAHP